jgi:hypothetical protein
MLHLGTENNGCHYRTSWTPGGGVPDEAQCRERVLALPTHRHRPRSHKLARTCPSSQKIANLHNPAQTHYCPTLCRPLLGLGFSVALGVFGATSGMLVQHHTLSSDHIHHSVQFSGRLTPVILPANQPSSPAWISHLPRLGWGDAFTNSANLLAMVYSLERAAE